MLAAHRLHQQASLGIPGQDDLTRVATIHPALVAVQQQAALELLGTLRMAAVTVLGQDRANLLLEEGNLVRTLWAESRCGQKQ